MSDFVKYFDETGRKTLKLLQLTEIDLNRWNNKTNKLIIYPYSVNLRKQADFTKAKTLIKKAETDRAGAATVNELNDIVMRLKERHRFHYRAAEILWMQ